MSTDNIAEIQISYSPYLTKDKRVKINNSDSAYLILLSSWNKNTIELQEEFKVLLLNNANEVLGVQNLSKGGTKGTYVDVKLLFAIALKACASGIIIAHNHPSGTLEPSESDMQLTKKIKKSGQLLEINLIDHLIVTKEGFYSFSDNCKL